MTTSCMHKLAWLNEPPYRYICLKCGARLKIASGIYPLTPKPQPESEKVKS